MEVFKKMVKVLKNEHEREGGWDNEWWDKRKSEIKKFLKEYPSDYNGGIIIPFTCNYETFIFPVVDGESYIETCNNHEWDEAFLMRYNDVYEHKRRSDNDTKFINVSTLEITTAPEFLKKLYESYGMDKQVAEALVEPDIDLSDEMIQIIENKFKKKIDELSNLAEEYSDSSNNMLTYYNGEKAGIMIALQILKGE